jgi:hypothetical protein
VREHVALVRPRPPREAYLLTETLPGEVAQVDWAHAGEIPVVALHAQRQGSLQIGWQ